MAINLQNFFRQTQGRDGTSRFVMTLSAPALALALTVIVVTLGWSFFMGFMVGRGQNPEKHIEEIAGILHQDEQQNKVQSPADPDAAKDDSTAAVKKEGQDPDAASGQSDGQSLKNGEVAQDDGAGQDSQNRDGAQKPAASAADAAQTPLKDAIKPKPQEKTEPAVPGFVYSYRLATVTSQEAAKSEQKRYSRKGVQCVIRKLGSGFSLNATIKGTEKDDQAFRQKLKSAGLGSPLLLSKKKR